MRGRAKRGASVRSPRGRKPSAPVTRRVFINCPFDAEYERLFLALVAGIVGVGCEAHCVLEEPSDKSRLERLKELLGRCEASIHDLSRVTLSGAAGTHVPRFNMPFELGLAYGRQAFDGPHQCFVFEAEDYRVDRSLSDIKGIDPYIHHGTVDGILKAVRSALGAPSDKQVTLAQLRTLAEGVIAIVEDLKATEGWTSAFDRHVFTAAVAAATEQAALLGLTPQ